MKRARGQSKPLSQAQPACFADRGPIALLEGRSGLAGRKSALPDDYQDPAVVSAHGSSVRRLAGQLQVSKSAVHRLVAKAREIDRMIGIGGAYVNREHYLLIAAFAPRPEALQRQRPLRPTYVDLFATVYDKDWDDVEGCDRIVAYVVEQLHRVEWDGILHVVADPRLAAVAARPKWFGGRDDISIHAGTSAGIWRFVLRQLVRGRATGWQSVALRILRSLNDGRIDIGTSPNGWITEYLSMMEWRARRSGWNSVVFLSDAQHLLQESPGRLLPLLQRARVVRDAKRSRSWVIRPLWR